VEDLKKTMPNLNTKTYVDIHTTGQRKEFSSIRQYDKFLKDNHSYVLTKADTIRLATPKPQQKMDKRELKDLATKAWAERGQYIPEIKKRIYEARKRGQNGVG
jgi:hypothetical protein